MAVATKMHLSKWPLVAAVFNLEVAEGLRPGPFITAIEAMRIARDAERKMIAELARRGVDRKVAAAYFRMKDDGVTRVHENLAALLPPPSRVRDDADPSRVRSLRRAVG